MAARVAKQAVLPGSQYDWRQLVVRLQRILLLVSVVGLSVIGVMKLNDPQFLPIQKVRAQGAFINLTEAMLLSRAGGINGGYFNIDVGTTQQNIESLAWVDKAHIKRIWPDTLMISVTEQTAVAWWQSKGLINSRGELFYPAKETFPAGLPKLNGPVDAHQLLLEHYQRMSSMLAASGLIIQQLDMDVRRSLILRFTNGLTILLGRDTYYLRLQRFIRVYKKLLVTEIDQLQQIDMRYTNGFTMLRKQ